MKTNLRGIVMKFFHTIPLQNLIVKIRLFMNALYE